MAQSPSPKMMSGVKIRTTAKNIAKWTKAEADEVAAKVMAMTTEAEVTAYLETVV